MKHMKKITLLLSYLLFSAAILFAQTPTGKVVLNKGQKFVSTTVVNSTVGMEMMGQNMETVSESSNASTLEVKDVTPTGYVITTTVNKMKMKSKGGMGQPVDFDSDKKEDMNNEIGKALQDQFSPQNVQINFAGKEVEQKDSTPNEDMMKVMQSIMSGMGEMGIAGNFILIPAGKKAGDSWTDSTNKDGMKIYNTYNLKQIDGNNATVMINTISNVNKTVQAQGTELTVAMDSRVTSNYITDISTGLIKEKHIAVEGKGTLNAAGQDMPMTTKATSTTIIKSM